MGDNDAGEIRVRVNQATQSQVDDLERRLEKVERMAKHSPLRIAAFLIALIVGSALVAIVTMGLLGMFSR